MKWEYKTIQYFDEKDLNELGDHGWELVTIITRTINTTSLHEPVLTAFLKREKQYAPSYILNDLFM